MVSGRISGDVGGLPPCQRAVPGAGWRKPQREAYLPADRFSTWHERGVFKRSPRKMMTA